MVTRFLIKIKPTEGAPGNRTLLCRDTSDPTPVGLGETLIPHTGSVRRFTIHQILRDIDARKTYVHLADLTTPWAVNIIRELTENGWTPVQ